MAIDSIIARPTNKVRVMVLEASGCCANEFRAVETARPSARAGAMLPTAIVALAQIIETIAIMVMLSINILSCFGGSCGGRNVNGGEDAEYVSLHHAGEQA